MNLYLAGPMTGIPQFNFPAFRNAAADLRARGYKIVAPNELDSLAVQDDAMASPDGSLDSYGKIGKETWGEILSRDVRIIADEVDGIVFLPDWERSRGARLEAFVALLTGKTEFYEYHNGLMRRISSDRVRWTMQDNMP